LRANFSKTGLLAFAGFLAAVTPMFSQTYQSEIEKHEKLPGNSIHEKVRRSLDEDLEEEDGIRELFALGDAAVPSLIKFLSDTSKDRRAGAARGLAYIGNQEGMRALRNAVKAERDEETKSAMGCFLAGGLLRPNQRAICIF
jgi:hypothetical protein